jgi:hypothetical protein
MLHILRGQFKFLLLDLKVNNLIRFSKIEFQNFYMDFISCLQKVASQLNLQW